MRCGPTSKFQLPGRRALALRAFVAATLVATCFGAVVISSTPTIVAAPTSPPPPAAAGAGAPAIAEYADGSVELLTLPPAPHVAPRGRSPAGAGGARQIRVAVALVNFAGAPVEPFAPEDVADTLFGPDRSLARLYDEQSFGLASVSGDVLGWITVARGAPGCDFGDWADSATAAIGANALSTYTNLLIVFPDTQACQWSGLAYVGGTTAWINGQPTVRAAAHEIGHNLGLGHASSLACSSPNGPVALSSDCAKEDEYGDPFTLMGSGGTLHINGIHKLQLGWLAGRNVVEVTESGSYELAPLGSTSDRPQILRIGRGDSTLVIEYRHAGAAFERFGGPFEPTGGVSARVADGPASAPRSLLVDGTPGTQSYDDATIRVGRELFDSATGVLVSTVSALLESAQVDIVVAGTNGASSTRLSSPAPVVAIVARGKRRTRVDLRWLAPGRAATARPHHYLVLRNGRIVARPTKPKLTRFERHGRNVYGVTAVARDGRRSRPSPRLVVSTSPPRTAKDLRAALRGIEAHPTDDGRVALSTRNRTSATVRLGAKGATATIPNRGALALQLSAARTVLVVRPNKLPGARSVQVVAVRGQALAG